MIHRLTVRISPELVEKLKELAKKHHRSLNSEIVYVLEKYVEEADEG